MRLPLLVPFAIALAVLAPPAASDATPYCTSSPNSTGVGATIRWEGALLPESGALIVRNLPPRTLGLFLYGQAQASTPFGNGVDCIGGPTWILARRAASNGTVKLDFDTGGEAEDVRWIGSHLGLPWYFQFMYRDQAAGGARFNLTDGVRVQFAFAGT